MSSVTFQPLTRVARIVVCLALALGLNSHVLAQDEPPAEEANPNETQAVPTDDASVAPTEDAPAPAEGSAAAAEDQPAAPSAAADAPLETIPVDQAQAQPPEGGTQFDAIEVTGSRLSRSDYETAQPVVVLTREDIERTGQTDINEILRRLNVAGNNSVTPAYGRSFLSMGEANLDLRNLGGQHTLLLVNGRRWVTGLVSTQPNISDLNTIPTSIIERIEVLKDGASAIYGSDAIAGVVNIITRKDYQGYGADYQFGQYVAEGDGLNQQASFDWGTVRQGTSAFLNISYTQQDRVEAANHDFTSSPMPQAGYTRWGNATPRGRYVFVPNQANADYYLCPNINAAAVGLVPMPSNSTVTTINQQTATTPAGLQLCDLHTLVNANFDVTQQPDQRANYRQQVKTNGEDLYNNFLDGTLQAPNKRTAAFFQLSRDLLEFPGVNFTFDALYNMRDSKTVSYSAVILGGNAFGAPGSFVSADHPQNPFQQAIGNSQAIEQGYGAWLIRTQTADIFSQEARTIRLSGTLRGNVDLFGHLLNWDFGYINASNKIEEITPLQRIDLTALTLGSSTDPDTGAPLPYDITPCTNTPGCAPLNIFQGIGGVDPAALAFIFSDVWQRNRNSQNIAFLDFSGEIPQVLSWMAGPIAAATGVEVRRDTYQSLVDPILKEGGDGVLVTLNSLQDSGGESEAHEAYVEFGIPVLKDLPLASVVDLDLAGRYSEYPGFATVTTYKAGLRWQPIDDLLVRGTYSTGFRAPSIAELYLPGASSYEPLHDPCISGDPNYPQSQTTQQNCAADNVVGTNSVTSGPYNLWQGNEDLEPEESINVTYGLIYSPSFVPDLNLAVDFYSITVDKFITIGPPLGQFFLDSCYGTTQREHCEKIHRDETGAGPTTTRGDVLYVDVPFFNLGKIETQGVDFDADYVLPTPEVFGRFKVRLDASYLTQFDQVYPQIGRPDLVDGRVGKASGLYASYPRWKALTELTWKQDQWSASWTARLAYHLEEPCGDFLAPSYRELGLCSNPVAPVFDDPATTDVDESRPDMSTNHMKSVVYHNLQIGRELPQWNTDITFGVHNVLDQDPPYSYSLIGSRLWFNYDPTNYEMPGRFGYLRIGFKF